MFMGAIVVRIGDGQVTNRPVYVAIEQPLTVSGTSSGCGPATDPRG
jgi:hypothetical protein